jgi:hypothetical protein
LGLLCPFLGLFLSFLSLLCALLGLFLSFLSLLCAFLGLLGHLLAFLCSLMCSRCLLLAVTMYTPMLQVLNSDTAPTYS